MVSTPARSATLMPLAPCACTATLRPCMCASSTMAATSSGVYCCAPTRVPFENTPPVPQYLITSAPYFTFSRTFARTAHGPSATPSACS